MTIVVPTARAAIRVFRYHNHLLLITNLINNHHNHHIIRNDR